MASPLVSSRWPRAPADEIVRIAMRMEGRNVAWPLNIRKARPDLSPTGHKPGTNCAARHTVPQDRLEQSKRTRDAARLHGLHGCGVAGVGSVSQQVSHRYEPASRLADLVEGNAVRKRLALLRVQRG